MTEPRPDRVRVTGPLMAFAVGFHAYLVERGYSLTSVQFHLQLLAHLSRWMQAEGLDVDRLSLAVAERFLAERRSQGYASRIPSAGLRPLTDYLDALGVLSAGVGVSPTEVDRLVEEFCGFLFEERHDVGDALADYLHRSSRGRRSLAGRKKDIIITSSGKNITAVNTENALRRTRWISEAIAYGDNRPYLVAPPTLDPEEAPKLAEQLGMPPSDIVTMVTDERVQAEIQKAVDAVNQRFARIEQIKRFAILDRQLSQPEGELTPTLKVKRALVYRKCADVFNGLYEG